MAKINTKECTKCNKELSITEFYKSSQNRMPYDVLCMRLADKIMHLQTLEREQIIKAYNQRAIDQFEGKLMTGEKYFDKNYI
jgi:hypothetical protein